jgi:hypothetical protein
MTVTTMTLGHGKILQLSSHTFVTCGPYKDSLAGGRLPKCRG